MTRHISLDASSTALGYVLSEDGKRRFSGTRKLTGVIETRIEQAYGFVLGLLDSWPGTEMLITEAPAFVKPSGLIPQMRVSGAIILAAQTKKIPWREATPTQAKKALTGRGGATKEDMLRAAAPYLGYDTEALAYVCRSDKWRAELDNTEVYSEDESDAVGVMLAAWRGDLVCPSKKGSGRR